MRALGWLISGALAGLLVLAACSGSSAPSMPPMAGATPDGSAIASMPSASAAAAAASASATAAAAAASASASAASAAASASASASAAAGPCPEDMAFVEGNYCPRVERTCLRKEMNKPNHLEICHAFAHQTKCVAPEEPRAFCIDRYEYPNQPGAHASWMVSWWDAEATCEAKGKRLCLASEWTMACEGPERLPFPYGWERDQTACNIDNVFINPHLDKMYSSHPEVSSVELERLDQSVASGALDRCVSGYGVHDLTGNLDEWVTRDDAPRASDKGLWSALKGGAWGHVRNACRPMTVSHAPEFTYYFVSFRCCADAVGKPVYHPAKGPKVPVVKPADKAPVPVVAHAPGPSKHKIKPEN